MRSNAKLRPVQLRRWWVDIGLMALAATLTALYVFSAGGGFPLDDSWIHQTYARNLATTGIWSFVPGVPSAASTSPLYTVVLAFGYVVGVPYTLWTHGVGAVVLGLTGIVGHRLASLIAPNLRWIGPLTGFALVLAWHLIWAAASGMETMLFSLLTLLLIWLVWLETTQRRLPLIGRGLIFGVVAGLTTLARPEGVLLVGLSGLALLVARPKMIFRSVLLYGATAFTAFLIVLGPYLLFNVQLTGGLLPNTAAAKQMWARPLLELSYPWRLYNVTLPLLAGAQFALIPGMVVFVVHALRRLGGDRTGILMLLLPAWGVGLIALYAAQLPLPFQHGRYVIPALPALIVAGVIGTGWLLRGASAYLFGRVLARTVALTAAFLLVIFALTLGLDAYRLDVAVIDQEMVDPALWVEANIPISAIFAVHDIGAVGYFASRPILDIAGLVSPEFIPTLLDPDAMWALLEERGAEFLMAMPDQVPGRDPSDPRLCPLYSSHGDAALRAGGEKTTIYRLAWDGACPS
ncbi:MAG: hypothetical protein SNJ59_09595 [Aggregatilineales bacterium]